VISLKANIKKVLLFIGVMFFSIGAMIGAPQANAALLNTELVVNGGAEEGDTTGWLSTGIDAVTPDTPAAGFGSFVFTGGTGPDTQTLLQTIDVSGNSVNIDAGAIKSIFGIELQSRADSDAPSYVDTAQVDVSFLDEGSRVLDSFFFVDTSNVTLPDWDFFSDTRLLPSGTRSIKILLTTNRTIGTFSDGFFDDVSLQLSSIPEPAAVWLFGSGIIGLLVFRRGKSLLLHLHKAGASSKKII